MTAKLWSVSPPSYGPDALETPMGPPPVVVARPLTRGAWFDRHSAGEFRRTWFPPTAVASPTFFVLDFGEVWPSPDVLEEVVIRLGQEIKAGAHGLATLAVSTPNSSLRRALMAVAAQEDLPLYLALSPSPAEIAAAEPAGDLTATDRQTLDAVVSMGGRISAADLARRLDLNHTAAGNRLASLAVKGYLSRQSRPGREGDLYVDPRFLTPQQAIDAVLAAARDAVPSDEFERLERLLRRSAHESSTSEARPAAV
jgi:hypothetical protein